MPEHIVKLIADYNTGAYYRGEVPKGTAVPRIIEGELGVLFEEETFIPYRDLGYSRELGFYSLSEFPEEDNESIPFEEEGVILTLGQTVITQGISYELLKRLINIDVWAVMILSRYARGNFGTSGNWRSAEITDRELREGAYVTSEDSKLNKINILTGINRILASYEDPEIGRVWIITEADRSVTTILKPEEY